MASTYRLNSSNSYSGRYMYLSCTQTKDIASNTSKISWTLTTTGGSSNYYTTGPTEIRINGEIVYQKGKTYWDTYEFPAAKGSVSGTITVEHDGDGNAVVPVTIKTNIYTGVTHTTNGTWTLDSNERFATLTSAPNFTDDQNPVIKYSNPAGSKVTKLQACITLDGSNADIAYRDISKTGTSYTFNLTDAERKVLRAATTTSNKRNVIFRIRTYIGDSNGASSLTKTLTIANPNPVIDPIIVDTNTKTVELTGDSNKLVRYYSNAKITFGTVAVKEATLKSKKVTCGDSSRTSDGIINNVTNNKFTFTATDSRGNKATKVVEKTFINYVKVTSSITNALPDTDGNMSLKIAGNYFNGYFGAVNNALNVYYRYKEAGASWTDNDKWVLIGNVSLGTGTYTATADITGLDYQTAYTFQAYARDVLDSTAVSEVTVKSMPVFDWGENDFKFNVPVNVGGQLTTDGLHFNEQEITVNGNLNTYYPVHVSTTGSVATPQLLFLRKDLNTLSPSWSGNNDKYKSSSIRMGWMYRGGGWDGMGEYVNTLYKSQPYASLIAHAKTLTDTTASGIVLYLRGGGATYRLASNLPFTATVYLSSTNVADDTYPETLAPMTAIDNAGVLFRNVPKQIDYTDILDYVYPVNSIYISYSNTSPASVFGGTWTRVYHKTSNSGVFLYGVTSADTTGGEGGEASVTLTVNQIPSHRHSTNTIGIATTSTSTNAGEAMRSATLSNSYGNTAYTAYTGGGAAHNNMPPYVKVSIWRRTA